MKWLLFSVVAVVAFVVGMAIAAHKPSACDQVRAVCKEAAGDHSQLKKMMACTVIGLQGGVDSLTEDECRALLGKK
jgi:hypothetical protein